ncbi:hypothetical protein EHM92_00240 [bacterium]|nr:MAG: hypothetical protein EHM92_00240 [bacterium]
MSDRRGFIKALMGGTAIAGLPAVREIKAAHLTENDLVVLEFPRLLSAESVDRIRREWKDRFPNVECLVLSEGAEIKVIKNINRTYVEIPKKDAMSMCNGR